MDKDTNTHPPILLCREKWKAAVVIYCSINASCGKPMRRPAPLFARGPRDNGVFSALKQVLAHNSVVFPGENRITVPADLFFLVPVFRWLILTNWNIVFQCIKDLFFPKQRFKHDNTITETKFPCQMFLSLALPGGNKSYSPLCLTQNGSWGVK